MSLTRKLSFGKKVTTPSDWRELAPKMKVTLLFENGSDLNTWLSSVKHQDETEVLTFLDGLERHALSEVTTLMRGAYSMVQREWYSSKQEENQ